MSCTSCLLGCSSAIPFGSNSQIGCSSNSVTALSRAMKASSRTRITMMPLNAPLSKSSEGSPASTVSRPASSVKGPSMVTSRGGMNHSMLPADSSDGVVRMRLKSWSKWTRVGSFCSRCRATDSADRVSAEALRLRSSTLAIMLPSASA